MRPLAVLAPPRCQLHSRLARPGLGNWLRLALAALRRHLRLRTRWRTWRHGAPAQPERLGAPSRFAAGTWVRIHEPARIFATLDRRKGLRGLPWGWQQWPSCGTVHRVLKPVRRMMDDAHRMRAIAGTVMIDTVSCGGPDGDQGCGRDCPMMYRDEWLEAAAPPAGPAAPDEDCAYATVRGAAEIAATLDADHGRRGLLFMPEMQAYAGQRFPLRRRVERVLDGSAHVPVAEPIHILEGLHCSGAILGADGPCDRACRLLWHEDWLRIEAAPAAGPLRRQDSEAPHSPGRKS